MIFHILKISVSVIIISTMLFLLLYICIFSNVRDLTIVQSEENFEIYQNKIQHVIDSYGLYMTEVQDPYMENPELHKKLCISIDDDEKIWIYMSNSAQGDCLTGKEQFNISYIFYDSSLEDEFNIELFVDIVNCVSGKKLSKESCTYFFLSRQFAVKQEGSPIPKLNEHIAEKQWSLNFLEEWTLYFSQFGNEKKLMFGGLTEQLIG